MCRPREDIYRLRAVMYHLRTLCAAIVKISAAFGLPCAALGPYIPHSGCNAPPLDLMYRLKASCAALGPYVTPSGCQVPPSGCQAPPSGRQAPPSGCQAPPSGCHVPLSGFQMPPSGCHVPPSDFMYRLQAAMCRPWTLCTVFELLCAALVPILQRWGRPHFREPMGTEVGGACLQVAPPAGGLQQHQPEWDRVVTKAPWRCEPYVFNRERS